MQTLTTITRAQADARRWYAWRSARPDDQFEARLLCPVYQERPGIPFGGGTAGAAVYTRGPRKRTADVRDARPLALVLAYLGVRSGVFDGTAYVDKDGRISYFLPDGSVAP
jgi:hypothetical protein